MNQNLTIDKYNHMYEIFDLLRKAANINDEEIPAFFEPEGNDSDESIFLRLCSSLQNSGQMNNSIKFNNNEDRTNYELIKKITSNFNAIKFSKKYDNWEKLYNDLTDNGMLDKGTRKKETNWQKYSKGLISGASYLVHGGFKKVRDLISLSNRISSVSDEIINKIIDISKNIHGLGFALTCDWLKECGCLWLVKPDVHIKEVYRHLAMLSKEENISDTIVIKDMFEYSQVIKSIDSSMTAYKLDKIIWLICTGNFYKCDIKIGRELITKNV
jgi:hypothetical protein